MLLDPTRSFAAGALVCEGPGAVLLGAELEEAAKDGHF